MKGTISSGTNSSVFNLPIHFFPGKMGNSHLCFFVEVRDSSLKSREITGNARSMVEKQKEVQIIVDHFYETLLSINSLYRVEFQSCTFRET